MNDFDLEEYIKQYSGYGLINRLLFITQNLTNQIITNNNNNNNNKTENNNNSDNENNNNNNNIISNNNSKSIYIKDNGSVKLNDKKISQMTVHINRLKANRLNDRYSQHQHQLQNQQQQQIINSSNTYNIRNNNNNQNSNNINNINIRRDVLGVSGIKVRPKSAK